MVDDARRLVRRLSVQIQPARIGDGTANTDDLIRILRAAADGVVLEFRGEDVGDDAGPYINLSFVGTDHVAAWSRLRALYDASQIGRQLALSTIVVCEGEHGWDDYLLLHHFDPAEKLDELREG